MALARDLPLEPCVFGLFGELIRGSREYASRWCWFSCFAVGVIGSSLMAGIPASAQERGLSGPSSVEADLTAGDGLTDPQFRSTFPRSTLPGFYAWKDRLAEQGINLGFDYLALGQWSSGDLGVGEASAGIARFFGTISAGGGHSFTFKLENRHAFGTVVPQFLGFDAGALSITGTAFNDSQAILTNLFWTYRDPEGRFTLQAGQIDVTDFLDVYGLVSPYTAFQNLAFNTNPTINAPNAGLGVAAGVALGSNFYAVASIADANADPSEPDTRVFSDGETFKSLEIGYTSELDRIYFDNIHLTVWQSDASEERGRAEDYGAALSASWFIDNTWMPFVRYGVSEGTAALYERSFSTGVGWYGRNTDLAGVGLNWAQAKGFDETQFTAEAFYRVSLSSGLQITPSLQYVADPILAPDEDDLVIFGLRARVLF